MCVLRCTCAGGDARAQGLGGQGQAVWQEPPICGQVPAAAVADLVVSGGPRLPPLGAYLPACFGLPPLNSCASASAVADLPLKL